MLQFLADENFHNGSLRGVRRRNASVDVVRVQDVGLSGADDPSVLEWAAQHGRVLLTHDVSTMTRHAYDRVQEALPMPGVFELSRRVSLAAAIEELVIPGECSKPGEWGCIPVSAAGLRGSGVDFHAGAIVGEVSEDCSAGMEIDSRPLPRPTAVIESVLRGSRQ